MKKTIAFSIVLCVMLITFTGCSSATPDKKGDLLSFKFKFNDLSVEIPQDISCFTDNGWKFADNFKDLDKIISNGALKSTYLEKGDNWFLIEIFNYSGNDKTVKECPIGRITYDFSGDLKIYAAGDYLLNDKTLDTIIKEFGDPMSQAEYSTYIEIIYDKNEQESIYDRITFRFDRTKIINSFDVVNFY